MALRIFLESLTLSSAFLLSHKTNCIQNITGQQTSLSMSFSKRNEQTKPGGTRNCPEISLKPLLSSKNEVAVFSLGWFWHPQLELTSSVNGVVRCVVGYTGGSKVNPEYHNILDSTEAVLVEYDPKVITYSEILDVVSVHLFNNNWVGLFAHPHLNFIGPLTVGTHVEP